MPYEGGFRGGWGGGVRQAGLRNVVQMFQDGRLNVALTLEVAVKMASRIVIYNAKVILQEEVRAYVDPGDYEPTFDLLNSFESAPISLSGSQLLREITNTSPHGPYVEDGKQPTSEFIDPVEASALAFTWLGEEWVLKRVRNVGWPGIHFMERALEVSYEDVMAVFRTAFANIGNPEGSLSLGVGFSGLPEDMDISSDSPLD